MLRLLNFFFWNVRLITHGDSFTVKEIVRFCLENCQKYDYCRHLFDCQIQHIANDKSAFYTKLLKVCNQSTQTEQNTDSINSFICKYLCRRNKISKRHKRMQPCCMHWYFRNKLRPFIVIEQTTLRTAHKIRQSMCSIFGDAHNKHKNVPFINQHANTHFMDFCMAYKREKSAHEWLVYDLKNFFFLPIFIFI